MKGFLPKVQLCIEKRYEQRSDEAKTGSKADAYKDAGGRAAQDAKAGFTRQ